MSEEENTITALNLVQCREIPAYLCIDATKTLLCHILSTSYVYSIEKPLFKIPNSVVSTAFGTHTYPSELFATKEPSETWENVWNNLNAYNTLSALYDKMEQYYFQYDRNIYLTDEIWIKNDGSPTSGYLPPAMNAYAYIEGLWKFNGSRSERGLNSNFIGNIYSNIDYVVDSTTHTTTSYKLGLENMEMWPFMEVGRFYIDNAGGESTSAFLKGDSTTRDKIMDGSPWGVWEQNQLTGEVVFPIMGIRNPDPTTPPASTYINQEELYTSLREPRNDTYPTAPKILTPIRDRMPNFGFRSIFSYDVNETPITVALSKAVTRFTIENEEQLDTFAPSLITMFKGIGDSSGYDTSLRHLKIMLSDAMILSGDASNIIDMSAFDGPSDFDRGKWGFSIGDEFTLLSMALNNNIEAARNERVDVDGKSYYCMHGASKKSRDIYQHHYAIVRLNSIGNHGTMGALVKDEKLYFWWHEKTANGSVSSTTIGYSKAFKDDFLTQQTE